MSIFSDNLKRLRLEKQLTQEQAADKLGVSAQSVSRWECGNTYPDVMLLPEIARLYCVTVDDLYRERAGAYANYANRLGSVYEATRDPEDFIRADLEYRKLLKGGQYDADDLRCYGVLHAMMFRYCAEQAMKYYDRVIEDYAVLSPNTVYRTKVQKLALLARLGRGQEALEAQREKVRVGGNIDEWLLLQSACYHVGDFDGMYDCFQKGQNRFTGSPETPIDRLAILYCNGGDACCALHRYEEAITLWDKALELDPELYDARYSKGFCYEQMGEYGKAREVWCDVAQRLKQDGYEAEVLLPLELAEKCRERMR